MQTAVRSDDTTMDGNEALTFVEGLAEKVAGHDYTLSETEKNAISSIKKFIERMLKDIVVQRNEDQDEADNIKNLIEGCATSATESLEKVAALNKAVGTARTQQSDCRVSEGKAKDEMSAACAAYDAYCQGPGSKVPDCLSSMTSEKMKSGDANTKKSVRSCLEEINVWFPPLWKMYANCKKHEGIRADQTGVCNNVQNSFEGDFCQYSLLLTTTCDTQDDCRSKNIDARAKSHAAVKIAEKARASDCEVGHKVKCLLAIFEETDNKKPGMLASCKSEKYTCPDGITYPEIPGPTPCTREPSNPCDDSWLQKEYKSKAWYDKAPAGNCIPCLKTPKVCPEVNPVETARTYSSTWTSDKPGTSHARSMLDSVQAWSCGKQNCPGGWMQIDLGEVSTVTGVVTQSRQDAHKQAVTLYSVAYSTDGSTWQKMPGQFKSPGKNDKTKMVTQFSSPIIARYVRLVVISWEVHASMRAGLLACTRESSLKAEEEAYFVEVSGACSQNSNVNGVYKATGTTADGRHWFTQEKDEGRPRHIYYDADCNGKGSSPKWIMDWHKPNPSLKTDLDNDGDCHYGAHINFDEPTKQLPIGTAKWKMYCGGSWQWVQLSIAE